tara:strand:- start:884 stop:1552 length:669 start_codon:yes stop_codon:yes gene_type:complete
MDMILILLTVWLVWRTCSPEKKTATSTGGGETTIEQLFTQPEIGKSMNEEEFGEDDEEVGPAGMPKSEMFGQCSDECPAGIDPSECTPCDPFGQVTPTPTPLDAAGARAEKKCPPSLVYTKKHLSEGDSEEGCWPMDRPGGHGSTTTKCIPGGKANIANFYDANQTQTVIDAIDRDPTRAMKIRQAPATANYDLRASPQIIFRGYPSMSFIKGNANTGLKTD